ncbi:molybdopterin molybdotransferase MoeA [Flavobacterium rhizosphaerae]|uniref:Molybdopterin molybdenumtransferase n=1 Tax=Flavobacterium rhizosphaerae TaxID=3163298 RepID=A0ABW8YXT8_9FLAO
MIRVVEAKEIIKQHNELEAIKLLPLPEASGLVVAKEVVATVNIPNFEQSSMDGYALKYNDRNKKLLVTGEMAAGATHSITITDGEAVRIFTGAPLPVGADTVVMQEKTTFENGKLKINDVSLSQGANVRNIGSEVKEGQIAMAKETLLSPAAIGFLAGIGYTEVPVYAAPDVCIILTGNELQQPGSPLGLGQVYESNSFQLKAALQKTGIRNITIHKAEDDKAVLIKTLNNALKAHTVVLLTGGVSVGDYDFVPQAAKDCGVEEHFHKIKQKPGKPLFFGTKEGKLVFGLPGNPSSSLTCYYQYVLPALEKAMHLSGSVRKVSAIATHNYAKQIGLTHFIKAFYNEGRVTPLHAQESYRLQSFAQANCLMVIEEDSVGCKKGDKVEVHLLPM